MVKTADERAGLFRKRDNPRPIVAVKIIDVDTSEKYEWSEMVAVRIYHCWRCTGEMCVINSVTSHEVAASEFTNSETQDVEFVTPLYDFATGKAVDCPDRAGETTLKRGPRNSSALTPAVVVVGATPRPIKAILLQMSRKMM